VTGKNALVNGAGVALAIVLVVALSRFLAYRSFAVRGAVITADSTPSRELPLADVEVEVSGDPTRVVHSDASGFFAVPIPLRQLMGGGAPLSLVFRHSGYQPLELHDVAPDQLCIARLTPLAAEASPARPPVSIGNIVAKYSISTTTMINIGSAVKTFEVVNQGNVPCAEHHPCSPDGRWAASKASATLDAGLGNEFRNARASCIGGPCPFTRIEDSNLNTARQSLHVSVLDWSDTATFVLEAEVYRAAVADVMRESYPIIFGAGLTFTLPAAAEGVSIQADVDKSQIVFPLGPALFLSWADCHMQVNKDQTRVYRCEMKPGYKLMQSSAR
jgi:hypothetical protein